MKDKWRSPVCGESVGTHWAAVMRPLTAAAPWLTLILSLLMLYFLGDTLTKTQGTLFELPAEGLYDGARTKLVAVVTPTARDTLIFFDDSRYILDDGASTAAFAEHLSECLETTENQTLLILADRRVSCGELMQIVALARLGGVKKVLLAARSERGEK